MRIKSLELVGFKSFPEKTYISLSAGITAVIGPNGCGKSNLVEAIRWVLGEQRTSRLRAARMEELIFAGTKGRKSVGMAEVTVTFTDIGSKLPIDYDELAISRRLFRSGESQYLLNKVNCRLKDITALFVDTGMGIDAYSLIEQNMVDAIISESREDRRALFEQAAGISQYRIQRHRADLKLGNLRHDMVRIEDVLSELEARVKSLRRQVRQAERYKILSNKFKELEYQKLLLDWRAINNQKSPLEKDQTTFTNEIEKLTHQLTTQEAALETLELTFLEQDQQLREKEEELNKRKSYLNSLENELAVLTEREKSYNKDTIFQQKVQDDSTTRIGVIESALEELSDRETELEQILEDNSSKESDANSSFSESQRELSLIRSQRDELHQKVVTIKANAQSSYNQKESLNNRVNELDGQTKQFSEQQTKITALKKTLQAEVDQLNKNIKSKEAFVVELTKDRQQFQSKQSELEQDIRKLKPAMAELKDKLDDLKGAGGRKLNSLVELGINKLKGPIIAEIKCPAEFTKALGAYLYFIQDSLLASSTDDILKSEQLATEKGIGRIPFLIDTFNNLGDTPNIPGVLGKLADMVTTKDSRVKGLLERALVVETLWDNTQLCKAGWVLVDTEGRIIRPDGTLEIGIPEDKTSGRLNISAFKDELAELEKEFQVKDKQLNKVVTEFEKTESALNKNQQELIDEKNQASAKIAELHRNSEELNWLNQRIINNNEEITNLKEKLDAIQIQQDQPQESITKLENELEEITEELEEKQIQYAKARDEIESFKVERVKGQSELKRTTDDILKLEDELVQQQNNITEAKSSLLQLANTIEGLTKKKTTINLQLTNEVSELSMQEEALRAEKQKIEELRNKVDQQRRNIKSIRQNRDEGEQKLHHVSNELSRLEGHSISLMERLREINDDKSITKKQLSEQAKTMEADLETLNTDIEKVKKQLERVGPVPDEVIEEYERENERLNLLFEQQKDLEEAREDLVKAIRRIDREARERFMATLEQVRDGFKLMFIRLFPGGEADLKLADPDNPLESDIDIQAQPRGKALENITLLSGGERALTAIALLFGIYLVRPSPFCVLDEVDAPLDDANVNRFLELLRSLEDTTQFIIITHNRNTMAAADYLYGVTMEDEGISKVLSLRVPKEVS